MEERRKTTSVRQLELMIEFLDGHRDLALGRVRSKEARALAERLWNECAEILNSEGPARTGKQWSKVWNDQKCKVRAKLVAMNANQHATGGGPSSASSLSPLEERIANIIGRDVGPLPNVGQDQFSSNVGHSVVEAPVEQHIADVDNTTNASPLLFEIHESEVQEQEVVPSHRPSHTGQTPPTERLSVTPRRRCNEVQARRVVRQQTRIEHALRRPTAQPPAQSGRGALDESRSMILRIEELRAESSLKMAEAAKLVAESIERFSQKFCRQPMDRD